MKTPIDPDRVANLVRYCLDQAEHDLPRALEVACANMIALQRAASAGLARREHFAPLVADRVPRLSWTKTNSTLSDEGYEP